MEPGIRQEPVAEDRHEAEGVPPRPRTPELGDGALQGHSVPCPKCEAARLGIEFLGAASSQLVGVGIGETQAPDVTDHHGIWIASRARARFVVDSASLRTL
jgi:hypothetical protein